MANEPTKLRQHCSLLYSRFESEAVEGVWSGKLIDTITDLGIPRGSYTRVLTTLKNGGCIEQSERGFRGSSLTVFILHHPPVEEIFAESEVEDLTRRPNLDTLASDIQAIKKNIGGINIVEAFAEVERRLSVITAQISQQTQQGEK